MVLVNDGHEADGWELRRLGKKDIEGDRPFYCSVHVMLNMSAINNGANDDDIRADLQHQLQWLTKNDILQLNDVMWIGRLPPHLPSCAPSLIFRLRNTSYMHVRERARSVRRHVPGMFAIASYPMFHMERLNGLAASKGMERICRHWFAPGGGCKNGAQCQYSHDMRQLDRLQDGWSEGEKRRASVCQMDNGARIHPADHGPNGGPNVQAKSHEGERSSSPHIPRHIRTQRSGGDMTSSSAASSSSSSSSSPSSPSFNIAVALSRVLHAEVKQAIMPKSSSDSANIAEWELRQLSDEDVRDEPYMENILVLSAGPHSNKMDDVNEGDDGDEALCSHLRSALQSLVSEHGISAQHVVWFGRLHPLGAGGSNASPLILRVSSGHTLHTLSRLPNHLVSSGRASIPAVMSYREYHIWRLNPMAHLLNAPFICRHAFSRNGCSRSSCKWSHDIADMAIQHEKWMKVPMVAKNDPSSSSQVECSFDLPLHPALVFSSDCASLHDAKLQSIVIESIGTAAMQRLLLFTAAPPLTDTTEFGLRTDLTSIMTQLLRHTRLTLSDVSWVARPISPSPSIMPSNLIVLKCRRHVPIGEFLVDCFRSDLMLGNPLPYRRTIVRRANLLIEDEREMVCEKTFHGAPCNQRCGFSHSHHHMHALMQRWNRAKIEAGSSALLLMQPQMDYACKESGQRLHRGLIFPDSLNARTDDAVMCAIPNDGNTEDGAELQRRVILTRLPSINAARMSESERREDLMHIIRHLLDIGIPLHWIHWLARRRYDDDELVGGSMSAVVQFRVGVRMLRVHDCLYRFAMGRVSLWHKTTIGRCMSELRKKMEKRNSPAAVPPQSSLAPSSTHSVAQPSPPVVTPSLASPAIMDSLCDNLSPSSYSPSANTIESLRLCSDFFTLVDGERFCPRLNHGRCGLNHQRANLLRIMQQDETATHARSADRPGSARIPTSATSISLSSSIPLNDQPSLQPQPHRKDALAPSPSSRTYDDHRSHSVDLHSTIAAVTQ